MVLVIAFSSFFLSPSLSPSLQGYKHQKAYIVAQNPLPSTICNFWKVIYDRKCAAVVMLTPLTENGQEVCSQYWPETDSVTSFGDYTVDNLGEESNNGFVIRQLSVLNTKVCSHLFISLLKSLILSFSAYFNQINVTQTVFTNLVNKIEHHT